MADFMTPTERSRQMSLVKAKNTKIETEVKKIFWSLGYRYKITNLKSLPGKPDIVFKTRRKVIFIHGCFWHRHVGCQNTRMPKSNAEFWEKKFEQNIRNDENAYEALRQQGWQYLVIWECMLKKRNRKILIDYIEQFMAENFQGNR